MTLSRRKLLWGLAFTSPILFSLLVIVVGFITPHYNHLNHTISRLAIEKYGWIQEINFIQFAIGLIISGFLIRQVMTSMQSKRLWLVITLFCAMTLVIVSLFPTDPIENVRFSLNLLSPSGVVHFLAIGVFFLVSPFGIRHLRQSLFQERDFSRLADFTAHLGYTVTLLCFFWMAFYISGIFLQYRGIFQKGIAILCIYWLLRMLWVIRRPLLIT